MRTRTVAPGPAALADALTTLPGVSLYDDQGTRAQPSLDVRGFALSPVVGVPQGVSVFLDGVRINEADAQEVNFDLLPVDVIERAELVRGPQPVFGKNSLGGALLLRTRRGTGPASIDAQTEFGAFGYRGAHVSASGSSRGFDGIAMVRASDENGWRADTPARTRLLFASAGHRDSVDDISLTLLAGHNRIYQAGSLPESWYDVERRTNYTGGDYYMPTLLHVALGARHTFSGGAHASANAFVRANDTERFNVNAGAPSVRSRTAARSVGVTAESGFPFQALGTTASFVVGVELARNAVGYRVYQAPNGNAEPEDECEPASGLCEHARVDEGDAGAYTQLVIGLPAGLSLMASARGDWVRVPFRDLRAPENDGTNVFRQVSPRVALTWRPSARARAFVAGGAGFRAPAALELACASEAAPCTLPFALGDDPPLAPVRVRELDVGGELTPFRGLALSGTGWRAETRNDIVFVASRTTTGFFTNVSRTSRSGVELTARATLPRGVQATASYSWVDARWRTSALLASANPDAAPVQPGDRMPLSPRHRTNAALGWSGLVSGWLLDGELGARAVSAQTLRGDEAGRMEPLPGYATGNLRLGADRTRIAFAATLTNVTNAHAATFGAYGLNAAGPPAGPAPDVPSVERFLTPLTPRAVTVSVTLRR